MVRSSFPSLATLALTLTSLGCGAAPECTHPPAAADAVSGPGRLDATLARGATRYQGVHKLKLRLREDGTVEKMAVYHRDASVAPAPVLALAQSRFPGSTVVFYEHELYIDRGEMHEVEVKTADGRTCEISASPAGVLGYEECELAVDAVPPAVKATLEARLPGGKIVEAESKKGPELDELSIEVEREGAVHYLRVRPDGTVLAHHHRVAAEIDVPVP